MENFDHDSGSADAQDETHPPLITGDSHGQTGAEPAPQQRQKSAHPSSLSVWDGVGGTQTNGIEKP